AEEKHRQEVLAEAQALGEQIKKMNVTLKIKSGEGGRTFGSVSTKEIAVAMKEQLKLDVDKKKLVLPEPIRTLGTTIVPVKLHPEVTTELTVKVVEA
ncbi:MAG: 50S ribosomal protein L9, partial [Lachnospiraceae bacterium]|nr:50S ribosomal protein L9 [Lachnospiraceae bacterium]